MIEGQSQREDFTGHKGIIGPGDVQWMTAGRGIVHSEMPVKKQARANGLQLWINLPKEHKMCEPQYQELLDGEIKRATPQDGIVVKIIAGESHGVKSQVYTRTPTMYLDYRIVKNKTVEQTIPASIKTKDEDAHFVVIAGEPIKEPIVQHGPFVMNTQQEIYETFVDYQYGQNGFERAKTWRSGAAQELET
ncbi:hypothetical protein BGZ74_010211 [Mortierella antarctica]|nr:hypothetical protein BGZ74_010211 [Mortierella antarctica]